MAYVLIQATAASNIYKVEWRAGTPAPLPPGVWGKIATQRDSTSILIYQAVPQAAVGVDVGENFLDLAVLRLEPARLEYHRVELRGIEGAPLEMLRERLAGCCPDAGPGWLALIDSPRFPLDMDGSAAVPSRRCPVPAGRVLDSALRSLLRSAPGYEALRLSMFPTPPLSYFSRCVRDPDCKPHLRSAYCVLFGSSRNIAGGDLDDGKARSEQDRQMSTPGGWGNFTRFMLAGFLVFKAWEALNVTVLEAYPYLQHRLWTQERLPPKRTRKVALAARTAINARLRDMLGLGPTPAPTRLDLADAEILTSSAMLAAKRGLLAALEHPAEGRFLLTFERATM